MTGTRVKKVRRQHAAELLPSRVVLTLSAHDCPSRQHAPTYAINDRVLVDDSKISTADGRGGGNRAPCETHTVFHGKVRGDRVEQNMAQP